MPAFVHRQAGAIGWVVCAAFGAGVIYTCWSQPIIFAGILAIAGVSWVLNVVEVRRQRRIAMERLCARAGLSRDARPSR